MATESKKKLALAVVDFLKSSCTDGTLDSEEKESIEIATQCIADAFKINPDDKAAMSDALAGQSLLAIYNVFEKMKGKSTPKPAAPPTGPKEPSDDERAEAEALKNKGNVAIAQKDYHTAIDFYTQALKITPTSSIYLSNRAAAYIQLEKYDEAIRDAEIAVDTDPSYVKAWSRLGYARSKKADHHGAMEAYKAGIDADGNGGSKALRDGFETARNAVDQKDALSNRSGPDGMSELLGAMSGAMGGQKIQELMQSPLVRKVMSDPKTMEELMNSGMFGDGGLDPKTIGNFFERVAPMLGGLGGNPGTGSGSGSNQ